MPPQMISADAGWAYVAITFGTARTARRVYLASVFVVSGMVHWKCSDPEACVIKPVGSIQTAAFTDVHTITLRDTNT
jgi:hypothetical protein